ncbi:MAG: hypothetical protein JNL18_04125 [Planctomycetaceae bacterium]|nr:hypothetical protein [Planctomycetaceae bacterium]
MSAYERSLADWSEELGAGRIGQVLESLAAGSLRRDVERFLENSLGERRRMLVEEVDLAGLAFENFEQLVDDYLAMTPRRTYQLDEREPQRFLRWLRQRSLTPQQADFVSYQESEYACYELARTNRQAHLTFQRLWTRSRVLANETIELSDYTPVVNPICVWSRLEVATLAVSAASRGDVAFFAVGSQILTLWPTERQLQLIASLLELGATAFAVCGAAASDLERQAVKETALELIAAGFLALSPISEAPREEGEARMKHLGQ